MNRNPETVYDYKRQFLWELKVLLALISLLAHLIYGAAPAKAGIHRYYAPDGTYVRCNTYVIGGDSTTRCATGEDARMLDREYEERLKRNIERSPYKLNDCLERRDKRHGEKYGRHLDEKALSGEHYLLVGQFHSDFYKSIGMPHLANDTAYAEYQAAGKACNDKHGLRFD